MDNEEKKSAGQVMRERFFEIKKNRKYSQEIKEILEKHKEEFLMNKKNFYKIAKNPKVEIKINLIIKFSDLIFLFGE
ncbi:hypothetical protein DOM21_12930 [Bacteriovorax stolpii]|uniref:hypothetical protein n=1 Tax=Bacteriovorax stolpii TaxID=960 RepID=UPI001158F467|nr:hypothetical protein [Bacteriovorax stolpii]QDK42331.1 hypothetical protein DOM21_12930 [Bacteriovorax stolpii]